MKTVIFCPRCDSEDVKVKRLTPERVKRVSMDELGNATLCHAVFRPIRYRATCAACGYEREYREGTF